MAGTHKLYFFFIISLSLISFGCARNQLADHQDAPKVSEVSLNKVKDLIDDRDNFTLIDSRPVKQFDRSHLPSAIPIPSCRMKENINLLPDKKGQLLIFYCQGPTYGMSTIASTIAADAGYKNIKVMLSGMEGWAKSGYRSYAADDFIEKGDAVLIDLRASRKNTKHKIAGSVSIPFAALDDRIDDISKKAPIVVYSDSIQESLRALESFRAAGFKSVSMVEGNFQGWKKRKRPVTSGPIVTEIDWSRKIGKGEVSPSVFKKAVNNRADVFFLDVRNSDETAAGSMKGAKLIPLNELYNRLEEIPKDKKIYIYSATGARAEMAGRVLKAKGYEAYFLVADISCHNDDCKIEF